MFWPDGCTRCGQLVVLAWVLAAAAGCQSADYQRRRLSERDAVGQVQAAVWLAEKGDAQALDRLVGLLEDRDRSVRMYAILALERLTGQTYGYRYYAPEAERRSAVLRWQEALRRGEVSVRTGATVANFRGGLSNAPVTSAPSGGQAEPAAAEDEAR